MLAGIEVRDAAESELLEVVFALRASSGLAGALHRGQQEPDERGDDRNHHEQLDEGEAAARSQSRPKGGTHELIPLK